ncbi:ATP-binding protein [Eisenibacter elegans]|uniref:ATP-binding protein n=1 Tax=Eisenibacter elegans TaxID=997 RepID=UPI0003FD7DF8|nr:ATP-binding protein [Eisenibacter elegans]
MNHCRSFLRIRLLFLGLMIHCGNVMWAQSNPGETRAEMAYRIKSNNFADGSDIKVLPTYHLSTPDSIRPTLDQAGWQKIAIGQTHFKAKPGEVHWVYFRIRNELKNQQQFVLHNRARASFYELQYRELGSQRPWQSCYSGVLLPVWQRSIALEFNALSLSLNAGKTYEVLIGINNKDERYIHLDFSLSPEPQFLYWAHARHLYQVLLLGFFVAAALYHLMMFYSLRPYLNLLFGLYLLTTALYFFAVNGYTKYFFFPINPEQDNFFVNFISGELSKILYLGFIHYFVINSQLKQTWLKYVSLFFLIITGLMSSWEIIKFSLLGLRTTVIPYMLATGLVLSLYLLVLSLWLLLFKPSPVTRFYAVGIGCLQVMGLVGIAVYHYDVNWYLNAHETGLLLQTLFFSLGLNKQIQQQGYDRDATKQALINQLQHNDTLQRQHARELQSRVEERTRQLSEAYEEITLKNEVLQEQSELLQAQNREMKFKNAQLAELNEEKDGIIGIVAHDLRAPLNRILGFSTLLRYEGELNKSQQQYLDTIEYLCQSGQRLINDLLEISYLESGASLNKIDKELSQFDLVEVLRTLVEDYEPMATQKQINLRLEAPTQLMLYSSEDFVRRIVENLLSNALKFSDRGTVQLSVSLNTTDQVGITVCDQGPGISPEEIPLLFKKFSRLSARPTGGESSTGLGLSIVKALTERLGGSIKVESALEVGACFEVTLPRNYSPTPKAEQHTNGQTQQNLLRNSQ